LEGLFTEEELANMPDENIKKLFMQANELAKGFFYIVPFLRWCW
jgi:hypothetical protein